MDITIPELQAYLTDRYGSWAKETGLFMKLVEEMGEAAEVLNMRCGAKLENGTDLQEELGKELADIIHYAVAIAAVCNIPLNDIMLAKDEKASLKYHHTTNLRLFHEGKKEHP